MLVVVEVVKVEVVGEVETVDIMERISGGVEG